MKGFMGRATESVAIVFLACIATSVAAPAAAEAFEQDQRVNSLTIQFGTDTFATANAFGSAFASAVAQVPMQDTVDGSVANGSTSWLLRMPGLTDLSGTNNSSFDVTIVDGTPRTPAGNPATYDGTDDLDWWYDPVASGAHQLPAASPPAGSPPAPGRSASRRAWGGRRPPSRCSAPGSRLSRVPRRRR